MDGDCSHCGGASIAGEALCESCKGILNEEKARLEQNFLGNDKIADAVEDMLDVLGVDMTDENYRNTPNRFARAFIERNQRCFDEDDEARVRSLLGRTFEHSADDFVVVDDVRAISSCAHHLETVVYRVHFGYIPDGKVVGLSKIPRLIKYLGKKPTLQEAYTQEIADAFHEHVDPKTTIVHVEGRHGCMADRGIEAHESNMTVTALRGDVREEKGQLDEFYARLGVESNGF